MSTVLDTADSASAAEVVALPDLFEVVNGEIVETAVYPLAQRVHAFRPGVPDIRVFSAADDLDAGDLLPGFRTPVASLFPPVESLPATSDE